MVADTDPPPRRRIDVTSFEDNGARYIGGASIDLEARIAKFESDFGVVHGRRPQPLFEQERLRQSLVERYGKRWGLVWFDTIMARRIMDRLRPPTPKVAEPEREPTVADLLPR